MERLIICENQYKTESGKILQFVRYEKGSITLKDGEEELIARYGTINEQDIFVEFCRDNRCYGCIMSEHRNCRNENKYAEKIGYYLFENNPS